MEATEREVAVGEFTVNYATAGSGEALILLHGSEPKENWRIWEPLLSLSDMRKLILPDLLGYGKSSKPSETPDFRAQARLLGDFLEKLGIGRLSLMASGWGGQVALEYAMDWPTEVNSVVLVASSYDKEQLPRLKNLRKPTLIIYAEDDLMTQLKAGYLLRDAIGTSRLEVLETVSRDPRFDFRMSHRLQQFRAPQILQLTRSFLTSPESMIAEPPEMENELRGLALRKEEKPGAAPTSTP